MAEVDTSVADQMMRELPGFYDHEKVVAYQNCIVDLAQHGGVNLLEMIFALRNVLLSVEAKLVEKAGEVEVPESLKREAQDEADDHEREVKSRPAEPKAQDKPQPKRRTRKRR